jgi:hypothetical protein
MKNRKVTIILATAALLLACGKDSKPGSSEPDSGYEAEAEAGAADAGAGPDAGSDAGPDNKPIEFQVSDAGPAPPKPLPIVTDEEPELSCPEGALNCPCAQEQCDDDEARCFHGYCRLVAVWAGEDTEVDFGEELLWWADQGVWQ